MFEVSSCLCRAQDVHLGCMDPQPHASPVLVLPEAPANPGRQSAVYPLPWEDLGPQILEAVVPHAAPSPLQKGTKVGISRCGAEVLGCGFEAGHMAVCSCWGCIPILARLPLPLSNLQGSYWTGRLVWERCLSIIFSSPLTDRDSQCGQRAPCPMPAFGEVPQLLEKLPVSSQAVCLQHRYLIWFSILFGTFSAFPGF